MIIFASSYKMQSLCQGFERKLISVCKHVCCVPNEMIAGNDLVQRNVSFVTGVRSNRMRNKSESFKNMLNMRRDCKR